MRAITSPANVSRAGLWFGLFGGGIAWTFHLLSAYAAAEFGCVGGLGEHRYWNVSFVAWMELALTALAVLVAAVATVVAYRMLRRLQSSTHEATAEGDAERYTARAGLLTSGIFTFVILFESIPILFYLRNC